MKDRPILFSGAMVRAILDGRKTQTRRVVKRTDSGRVKATGSSFNWHLGDPDATKACPYGQPGDRLWVREAWRTTGDDGRSNDVPPRDLQPYSVWYEADGEAPKSELVGKYRPSMFMPRWASRITLEITGVRVERVQEISEDDAKEEGWVKRPNVSSDPQVHIDAARDWYADLWDSINKKKYPWSENPWVWVIEFRRIE